MPTICMWRCLRDMCSVYWDDPFPRLPLRGEILSLVEHLFFKNPFRLRRTLRFLCCSFIFTRRPSLNTVSLIVSTPTMLFSRTSLVLCALLGAIAFACLVPQAEANDGVSIPLAFILLPCVLFFFRHAPNLPLSLSLPLSFSFSPFVSSLPSRRRSSDDML